MNEQVEQKQAIGRQAAKWVEPGMTVFLDGGSTVYYASRLIEARPLQVVTNSLTIAGLFADDERVELVLIGGTLYPRSGVLVGPIATKALGELHADLLLFSLAGIYDDGCYNQNLAMAEVEQMGSAALLALLTVIVLVICWRWAVRLVRRLRSDQLSATIVEGNDARIRAKSRSAPLARRRAVPLLLSILGGLVASFGGMITLGLSLAFLIGGVQKEHTFDVLVGGVLVGLVPVGVGVPLFLHGVRGLNAKGPVPASQVPADANQL
jgi:hypothetical protein